MNRSTRRMDDAVRRFQFDKLEELVLLVRNKRKDDPETLPILLKLSSLLQTIKKSETRKNQLNIFQTLAVVALEVYLIRNLPPQYLPTSFESEKKHKSKSEKKHKGFPTKKIKPKPFPIPCTRIGRSPCFTVYIFRKCRKHQYSRKKKYVK